MKRMSRGSILVMTLLMFGVFLMMMIGGSRLVNRQFHETTVQAQRGHAFQIADAGVNYAVWLLNNGILNVNNPQDVTDHAVTDFTQVGEPVIGSFDLSFTVIDGPPAPYQIDMTAIGTPINKDDLVQTVEATIESSDGEIFVVTDWNYVP